MMKYEYFDKNFKLHVVEFPELIVEKDDFNKDEIIINKMHPQYAYHFAIFVFIKKQTKTDPTKSIGKNHNLFALSKTAEIIE